MKQIAFSLVLIAAVASGAIAQTEQGNFLVGGNVQLNTAKNNTQVALSPSIGYFLVENFALGANIDLEYSKVGENPNSAKATTFGIGPFVRYYVGTPGGARPFLQGDVDFRSTKVKTGTSSSTSTGTNFFFGPGVAIFLNRNVALEGLAGYSHTANKNQEGSGGFALKFGFQVYLTGREVQAVTNGQ
jgi:hypothetical protein